MSKKIRLTETYKGTTLRKMAEGEARVDREAGILRGVKLLGYESKNDGGRRRYRKPEASLYENVPININHPGWEDVKVQDRWGVTIPGTIAVEDDGVYGDVQYNPHKPSTEEILWWAENHPDQLGMSHVALGHQEEIDGLIWLDVVEVESVDLVARPATTNGFFEADETNLKQENIMDWEKKYNDAVAAHAVALAESEQKAKDAEAAQAVAEQALATEKQAHEDTKRDHAREALLAESEIGEITPAFKKAVLRAESDEDAKALIDSVKESASALSGKPRSVTSTAASESNSGGDNQAKDFKSLKESGAFDYK